MILLNKIYPVTGINYPVFPTANFFKSSKNRFENRSARLTSSRIPRSQERGILLAVASALRMCDSKSCRDHKLKINTSQITMSDISIDLPPFLCILLPSFVTFDCKNYKCRDYTAYTQPERGSFPFVVDYAKRSFEFLWETYSLQAFLHR